MDSNEPIQDKPSETETSEILPDVEKLLSAANQEPASPPPPGHKPSRAWMTAGLILLIVFCLGAYFTVTSTSKKVTNTPVATTSPAHKALPPAQVSITNAGFVPASITVKVGQPITWTNKDSTALHLVASDPYPTDNAIAGFNAKQDMSFNDSYGFVFQKAGTYSYHDNLNPFTVQGTIIVKN